MDLLNIRIGPKSMNFIIRMLNRGNFYLSSKHTDMGCEITTKVNSEKKICYYYYLIFELTFMSVL